MVLETSQPLHPERGVHVGEYLADATTVSPAAADVDETEARYRLAVHAAELGADDLVTSTHRQHHRAALGRAGQPAVGGQPARGEYLRQVLTAAEQVDVAVRGHPLVGVDLGDLYRDPAQLGTAGQHQHVAPVAVGTE